jgi:hypothetical protein
VTGETKNFSMMRRSAVVLATLCLLLPWGLAGVGQTRPSAYLEHGEGRDAQTEAASDHFYNMDYDRATQEFEKIVA